MSDVGLLCLVLPAGGPAAGGGRVGGWGWVEGEGGMMATGVSAPSLGMSVSDVCLTRT